MSFATARFPTLTEMERSVSQQDETRWGPACGGRACSLGPADQRLVLAIQTGDSAAASPLYDELRPKIEKALRRVLRESPQEMDDLTQITFERVVRGISNGTFEGRSQLGAWASSIAAHVAIDWLRKHTHERRMFSALDYASTDRAGPQGPPDRLLEARVELRRIQEILDGMKPRRANVLFLHDVLGHSVPQIANLLRMNVSGTQSLLRRARREFRRRYLARAQPAVNP